MRLFTFLLKIYLVFANNGKLMLLFQKVLVVSPETVKWVINVIPGLDVSIATEQMVFRGIHMTTLEKS